MSLFCPKCKALMFPSEGVLKCRKCEYEKIPDEESSPVIKEGHVEKEILILDDELRTLPTTAIECPKCGHNKAAYIIRQMRAADEPSTRIYRCLKCTNTWREQ